MKLKFRILIILILFVSFSLNISSVAKNNNGWDRETLEERLRIKIGYFTGVSGRNDNYYYPSQMSTYNDRDHGWFNGNDMSYGFEYVIPNNSHREVVLSFLYVPGGGHNNDGWSLWPHYRYPFPEDTEDATYWIDYNFRYWQAGLNFFSYSKPSNPRAGRLYAGGGIAISRRDDDLWGYCEKDGDTCDDWGDYNEIKIYNAHDDHSDVDANLFLGWESYSGFHIQGQYVPDEEFGVISLGYDFFSRAERGAKKAQAEKVERRVTPAEREVSPREKKPEREERITKPPVKKEKKLTFANGSDNGIKPGDVFVLYVGDEVVGTGEVISVEKEKCKVTIKSLSEGISIDDIDGAVKQE